MTINSALKDWVAQVTGYGDQNIIAEHGNGPRPIGDFATFDVLTFVPVNSNHPNVKKTDQGDQTILYEYETRNEMMVSIEVYALDGMAHLKSLGMSNQLSSVRRILSEEKLAILRPGQPRKIPFDSDTNWKPRFQCDFVLNSYHAITEVIEQIEAYDFTGSFVRDENIVETIGFSIP